MMELEDILRTENIRRSERTLERLVEENAGSAEILDTMLNLITPSGEILSPAVNEAWAELSARGELL